MATASGQVGVTARAGASRSAEMVAEMVAANSGGVGGGGGGIGGGGGDGGAGGAGARHCGHARHLQRGQLAAQFCGHHE